MNTTTLNMTTLDGGNAIIKKGEGGGSTPPSGGESGDSNMEYLDVRGIDVLEQRMPLLLCSCLVNYESAAAGGKTVHTPTLLLYSEFNSMSGLSGFVNAVKYCAIRFGDELNLGGTMVTIEAFLTMQGITREYIDSIPHITKEEFYTLD